MYYRYVCWGEDTWVFVRIHPGGHNNAAGTVVAEPRRLRDVQVGDYVRTPRGYRAVQRMWISDYRASNRDTLVVRFEGWVVGREIGVGWEGRRGIAC